MKKEKLNQANFIDGQIHNLKFRFKIDSDEEGRSGLSNKEFMGMVYEFTDETRPIPNIVFQEIVLLMKHTMWDLKDKVTELVNQKIISLEKEIEEL